MLSPKVLCNRKFELSFGHCIFIWAFVSLKYTLETEKWFSFLGEEDDETVQIRGMKLGFEIPKNFLNPEKYRPSTIPEAGFAAVPDVISSAVFQAMPAEVPIDAFNPFIYLRNGVLPEFVVVYFMRMVSVRIKSNMTRFFTAMHLIEMYREYIIIPPSHFMSSFDTAAVVPGQDKQPVLKAKKDKKKKEENLKKEEKAGDDDEKDAQASSSKDVWRKHSFFLRMFDQI